MHWGHLRSIWSENIWTWPYCFNVCCVFGFTDCLNCITRRSHNSRQSWWDTVWFSFGSFYSKSSVCAVLLAKLSSRLHTLLQVISTLDLQPQYSQSPLKTMLRVTEWECKKRKEKEKKFLVLFCWIWCTPHHSGHILIPFANRLSSTCACIHLMRNPLLKSRTKCVNFNAGLFLNCALVDNYIRVLSKISKAEMQTIMFSQWSGLRAFMRNTKDTAGAVGHLCCFVHLSCFIDGGL